MKNNMMKKLLTLVLAGAMTLSLAACATASATALPTRCAMASDGSSAREDNKISGLPCQRMTSRIFCFIYRRPSYICRRFR